MDNSWERKAKDTFAGFVGGAVQVLVGQPFDLVKVRLQTGQFNTIGEVLKTTLAKEGPLAFYKGTSAPLFGVGACVSIQFYTFHEVKRRILSYTGGSVLSYPQIYVAGAAAGLVNTLTTSPIEQSRILMQAQTSGRFSGAFDAAKQVFASEGLRGIYRGSLVTALREIQAYGTWFLTYEFLVRNEMSRNNISRENISTIKLMAFGALAGEALWLASYPLDVIKSRVQSDGFGPRSKYHSGALNATIATYREAGLLGFWRGLLPTLLRAIPASACTFASVELTLRALG